MFPRIMPGVGQSVAAAVTQHMDMHLVVGKAGAPKSYRRDLGF
jgi:hypothetical protein